jgi:hypothetical protein
MSIPSVSIKFVDGGLGILPPGPGGAQAAVGVSLSGTVNTIYPVANGSADVNALGGGPLAESCAAVNDVTGTVVYAVPCPIVSAGSVSAWTQVGSGAGVVSATVGPHVEVDVKCSTGGAVGTAAFQLSVNGGAYGAPVVSVGTTWAYRVPGTFCTLTFAAATYRANDVYQVPASGVVSASNPAGGPATITQVSSPLDGYALQVVITTGGARGTAQFTYSLDAAPDSQGHVTGTNVSSPILTAATYVIPGSGIILGFTSATYVQGDVYSATATPPWTDNAGIGSALDVLTTSQFVFEGVHIVGVPLSAADAATLATAADAKMTTAEANQRYLFTVIDCPQSQVDGSISSAFVNFASVHGRIVVDAGDEYLVSTLTGLNLRRNGAWSLCARLASSKLSESPGKVSLGPLPNVTSIVRNEESTPGLCDARFVTLRTVRGKSGYYITDGPTMAPLGSDYSTIMNVRVANRAATTAAAAFVDYLNTEVRVNSKTGYIDERDAGNIDAHVSSMLRAALQGTPGSSTDEVSAVSATMSRTDNLLSNPVGTAVVTIVPKGYLRSITVSIGFRNPLIG